MLEATIVFSVAAFIGNFGVALTGFGMAIFFLFVYNIGEYAGAMDTEGCDRCGIKDAVFYQTIALFAAIPVLVYRARDVIREHRNKTLLVTFIPATIVGTPVGNFLQEHLPSDIVRLILGIAITFALVNTLYRQIIQMDCYKRRTAKEGKHEEEEGYEKITDGGNKIQDVGEIAPFPIKVEENTTGIVQEEIVVKEQEENQSKEAQSHKSQDDNESEVEEISSKEDSDSAKENTAEIIAVEEGLVQVEEENQEDSKEVAKTEESPSQNQDNIDTEMLEGRPLKIWGTISGFLSGFLGGLIGVRGPPLMVFFLYFSFPKNVVRANSILILLVNVTIRVVYYIIEDVSGRRTLPWFERELWYLYLCLIFFGIIGVPIGQHVASRVSQNQFKLIIALMLLMSGVSNMIKGSMDIAKGT